MQFMAWHRFKIKGKHYMTKRMRTLDVIARSDVAAKQKAITKKLLPPFICEEIDFEPPSQKLLEQAAAAGIDIPENASADDVACLLDRKNDIAPPAGLTAFAERWDIYFSQYIGNKELLHTTFKELQSENKAAFFIFYIYRFLSGDKKANLDTHPYKDTFYKFSVLALNDSRLMRSIANYKGENLCAFGSDENLPAGYKAGGVRTIAYKAAIAFINKYFDSNYQPRPLKDDGLPAACAAQSQKTLPAAAIKTTVPATKLQENSPSVFILSKNDTFIPTKAIELKSKIVKIPDLENKAVADLPVYSAKNVRPVKLAAYSPNQKHKPFERSGCLAMLIALAVIVLVIISLLF